MYVNVVGDIYIHMSNIITFQIKEGIYSPRSHAGFFKSKGKWLPYCVLTILLAVFKKVLYFVVSTYQFERIG